MKILITFLLVLIIIGVLLVGGVWFLFSSTGNQVDTDWSEEDFASGLEKSKINIGSIEEINLETLVRGGFTTEGASDVDEIFTSEEMSALVTKANQAQGPVRNVRVSFGDNGQGEVSFELSDNAVDFLREHVELDSLSARALDYANNVISNTPIYASGQLTRTSESSVGIDLDRMFLGRLPLPGGAVSRVETEVERIVNTIITPENGFHIEELQVKDGNLNYKGTLPAEIEGQSFNQ